jgi:aminoglycoside phosphotransferase (APT) family kinase protein
METQTIRPGEEIETDRLRVFLEERLGVAGNEIELRQFPAGSSNLTYLVKIAGGEYVLRRPPLGNTVKTAHDMSREFHVLSHLSKVFPPAPKPLVHCDDPEVIGSEFYLMERRQGVIIRGRLPKNAATHHLERSQSERLRMCRRFIGTLAELHSIDPGAAGLDGFGRPEGYCQRQVDGWTRRYQAAATHDHRELERVIEWLATHVPSSSSGSLIHNDYKFDNVMLDPGDLSQVTAVLDWEMATIGDPLMDLGTTLGYWMSSDAPDELLNMPFNPRVLMVNVGRSELVEMYSEASGLKMPDVLFYYVFGTFKIAVIAQQIFARFAKGFTSDPRFANFDRFVGALGGIGSRALESGRI